MLKTILNPNLYHGEGKADNFFEGWYFKIVDPSNKYIYCFIPGITLSDNAHSFIQVLEGHTNHYKYLEYNADDFKYNPLSFNIEIANNSFSISEINLNLIYDHKHIKGHLKFQDIKQWPDNIVNPGSMGFYNYLTFMQCYSQVCCIDSNIFGELIIDGKPIDFTGGKAYIEKNWGKAFPNSYIWAQCSNFNISDTSISCSIANIPLPISSFTGFLIGLYAKGDFYKFTSINRSKLSLDFSKNNISISACNKNHILKFKIQAPSDSFMELYAPKDNKMLPIAKESLQGKIFLELFDRHSNRVVYTSEGYCCGLEFGGNYKALSVGVPK